MHEDERPYHEVANIFPLLQGAEFEQLKADIQENGLLEDITIHPDGSILDGRNRYRACIETGTPPRFKTWNGKGSLVAFVVSMNLHRRHLNETQRGLVAARLANMKQGERTDVEPCANLRKVSQAEAAEMLNVSRRTVQAVKAVERKAPDLIPAMEAGEMTANKAIQTMRRREKIGQLEDIASQEAKAIEGVYDVIVIDPPWQMEKIERDVRPNQVEFDYPAMTESELATLDIPCSEDCHVWLWTTHKHLPMALRLLDAWGLKYVCTFVWHKPGGFQPVGLPQYNCEFAIYARFGAPIFTETKAFPVCFDAQRGAHSEKPEAFYGIVRRVTIGRRLDMFSRRNIEGFDAWGNEA